MIASDLRFEGFDVRSWTNLLSLFLPGLPERLERATGGPRGTATLLCDHERRVVHALHSIDGRIDRWIGKTLGDDALAEIATEVSAHRVLVLRVGAMEELAERVALRHDHDADYLAQLIGMLRAAREMIDSGWIELWPNPVANLPLPSAATVDRALDIVLPNDRAALVVLWDRELWTAVALRRRAGAIDRVAGPDLLRDWAGPLGGDWRRDYRVFVDAVARSVAPVHLGIFAEAETARALLRGTDPGRWARAVAVRDLVINPMPRFVMAGLGADAARGVGRASAKALGGLDLAGAALPIAAWVRQRLTDARTVRDVLGFDPLELLSTLLRREPEPEAEAGPEAEAEAGSGSGSGSESGSEPGSGSGSGPDSR